MTRTFDARDAIKGRTLKYDPAKLLPKFETPAVAKKRNRQLISVLYRQESLLSHYLASALSDCGKRINGKRDYCISASCPNCMRHARRWLTDQVATCAKHYTKKSGNSGVFVTIILSGLQAPISGLHKIDIAAVKRRVSRALTKLSLGLPIIGGIDVSFNEEAGSKEPGHYQVHVVLYVADHGSSKKARRRLNDHISSSLRLEPRAYVRVQVKRFKNPVRQGSYLLKSRFDKRLSFIGKNGRRRTKKFSLKPEQLAEIAVWLRPRQPLDRLLLHGVRLKRDRLVVQPHRIKLEMQP